MDTMTEITNAAEYINPVYYADVTDLKAWLRGQSMKAREGHRTSTVEDAYDSVLAYLLHTPCMTMDEYEQRFVEALQDRQTFPVLRDEPYLLNGCVTRKVRRCGTCMGRIDKHDKYCRTCGRAITGKEEEE